MIAPTDPLRRAEHAARMRLGVLAAAPAVAVGLALEGVAPGAGLLAATLAGLVAVLAVLVLHAAHARAVAGLAASAAEAAMTAAACRLAACAALTLATLATTAARRRTPRPLRLPAAGVALAPRILPRPIAARA